MDLTLKSLIILFVNFQILLVATDSLLSSECKNDGPLGMISEEIKDWQITASTTSSKKNCEKWRGRLYQRNKRSWCPKYNSSSEWLQIDLGVSTQVTGVMTQGRGDGNEFVKEFKLSHSSDGILFIYIKDSFDNQKIFEGNSDSYTVKHNYLDEPVQTRYIKFHIHKWQSFPSLRVEILGCQACKRILSVPPYARFTASSSRGKKTHKTCTPEYGHLYSNKAWCTKKDKRQWIEVDIGPPTLITGLITKGRGDSRKRQWVKKYRISYSTNGRKYHFYKAASYMDPKIFEGNFDKDTEQVHYLFAPFTARFVRFHPLEWEGKISMRVGVMGCPQMGDCGEGFFRINNRSSCVANLAYNKAAGIDLGGNRHRKRHLRVNKIQYFPERATAQLAVDGGLQKCAVLRNLNPYTVAPTWFVDMSEMNPISGVMIYLSKDKTISKDLSDSLLNNLDQLVVYVSEWHREYYQPIHRGGNIQNVCGMVDGLYRLNRMGSSSDKSRIHIPCKQPIRGRYVYVEARGITHSWSKKFAAVLCEVMIY